MEPAILGQDLRDRGKLDLSEAFIDASFSSARKGAPPSAARLSPWLCSSITSGGF
jgi:hypothetical protein